MNELMEFFSTYRIDWIQTSLLALGVAGASGLVIKKVISKKKKHWSETTRGDNQGIVPFSVPHATNYDSMVTEEVNNFLMPKAAIDDPKEDHRSEEDFKLEKPSVHSAVEISPEYHPPVTSFVAPDLTEYEQPQMIDVPAVEELKKEGSNEFNFLDSFDESSKLPGIVPLPYVLNRPSVEPNDFPTLTQEDTAPKSVEKTLDPSFSLELPSLTTLYPTAAPKLEKTSEVLDIPLDIPHQEPLEDQSEHINIPVLTQEVDLPFVQSTASAVDNTALVFTPEFEKTPVTVEAVTPEPEIAKKTEPLPVENNSVIAFTPEVNLEKKSESVFIDENPEPVANKSQYYMGIPTLTDIVAEPVNTVNEPTPVEEKFVPTVKPEIDEEKFEFTKKYHVLIEEALYFDSQNNKEAAMNSLLEAGKLIENIRVNFYLKIAMQSYKNAMTTNALPSIINQFYIIEKEKLMKEDAKKKQDADVAALKAKKLSPVQAIKEFRETNNVSLGEAKETVMSHPAWTAEAKAGDNLHTQLLEVVNEPVVSEPVEASVQVVPETPIESVLPEAVTASPWEQGYVLFTSPEGELVALKPQESQPEDVESLMPLSRPATPWKEGSVVFLGEDGNYTPYKPDILESPVESNVSLSSVEAVENAVEDVKAIVEESNPPLPPVNEPTIEEIQIESVEDVQIAVQDVVITEFEELPASESVNSEAPSIDESQALQLHQEPISFVENATSTLEDNKEELSQQATISDIPAEEAFNSEPVLAEGVEPVSFEDAFVTTTEEVQQEVQSEAQDLQAFMEDVNKEPLEEITAEPIVLTVEENEPLVEFAPFEDPVEHNAAEGLLSDPELSPVAETIAQEIENRDVQEPVLNQDTMAFVEPEQSTTQTIENPVADTVSFQDNEIGGVTDDSETTISFADNIPTVSESSIELVQSEAVLPSENMNHNVESVTTASVPETDNYAKVISSLEQTSAWFNKPDNMQVTQEPSVESAMEISDPEAETSLSKPIEKSSIEDEFSDEETKNKFMDAFGDMFKPNGLSETPTIIIPQKRKHTVWVNWMSTQGGKMNFKNDMIELNAVWGTKTAIEDLHQQLQALVGPENQFSVVSVFEAK
jgi:ribosomal protein L7/L12